MYSFIAKDLMYSTGENNGGEEDAAPSDPPSEVPPENPPEEIEPIKANRHNKTEYDKLISTCQDGATPGFVLNPTFNYTPPGQHAGSSNPYLRLGISSINNNTEEFVDVSIFLFDHLNGINTTISLDNIKKDSYDIFEFKGAERDLGMRLHKLYKQDKENYTVQCVIEFYAMINEVRTKISHPTFVALGSLLD